jgi:hypothetical protein
MTQQVRSGFPTLIPLLNPSLVSSGVVYTETRRNSPHPEWPRPPSSRSAGPWRREIRHR